MFLKSPDCAFKKNKENKFMDYTKVVWSIRSESSDIRILCQKYKMETSNLHPCGICGTMAVNLDSLMSHLTEKHPNILHYTCHVCNKEFKNYCVLIRLQTHFVTFHSGKPPPSLTEQVEQATTIQGSSNSGYVPIYNIMLKEKLSMI